MKASLAVLGGAALGIAACASASRAPESRALTIVGVFDSSWPYPGEVRQAGIPVHVTGPGGVTGCGAALDTARTDSAGRFQLVVPASALATRADWRLCTSMTLSGAVVYPMFRYTGGASDRLRVYCRGHGPQGSPQCLEIPEGAPMRWPGPPEEQSDRRAEQTRRLTTR